MKFPKDLNWKNKFKVVEFARKMAEKENVGLVVICQDATGEYGIVHGSRDDLWKNRKGFTVVYQSWLNAKPFEPIINKAIHGNGSDGQKLADFNKGKGARRSRNRTAKGEKSQYADKVRTLNPSEVRRIAKAESNENEWERDYKLRFGLGADKKAVSDKKGAKRRRSAKDVQK